MENFVLTQKGFFWFCNQNHNFFCSEYESYLYEKASATWKSTKQPLPRCEKTDKLAKMHVVKDLLKAYRVDPSSYARIKQILAPFGFGVMRGP